MGAHRTYYIPNAGDYILETMGARVYAGLGHFNVRMACSGGAESASPEEGDPLGFSVDVNTGPSRARHKRCAMGTR